MENIDDLDIDTKYHEWLIKLADKEEPKRRIIWISGPSCSGISWSPQKYYQIIKR